MDLNLRRCSGKSSPMPSRENPIRSWKNFVGDPQYLWEPGLTLRVCAAVLIDNAILGKELRFGIKPCLSARNYTAIQRFVPRNNAICRELFAHASATLYAEFASQIRRFHQRIQRSSSRGDNAEGRERIRVTNNFGNTADTKSDDRLTVKRRLENAQTEAFVFGCVESGIRGFQILFHRSCVPANNDAVADFQFVEQRLVGVERAAS